MKISRLIPFLLLPTFFTGCQTPDSYVINPRIANLSIWQKQLLEGIQRSHIQVVKEGLVFHFYLSTDKFFTHDTRELRLHKAHDLYRLAAFVRSYARNFAHPKINVTGFSDTTWPWKDRNMLSMHYAQSVAHYLSQGGVPYELMIITAKGSDDPVASDETVDGRALNRRVEITVK